MKKIEKSIEIGGRKLTFQTGELAPQATSAVLGTHGETVVLASVVSSPLKEDRGYFPLFVEYQERLYAGGKIKGSRWVKREGRPTDDEILNARLIDRSIRPLFPENYKREVQVIVTVLAVDLENDPAVLAANVVSAALSASSIPWKGPVGVVRAGSDDNGLDLIVSGTDDAIVMIEAGAREVPEEEMLEAIEHSQKEISKMIGFINELSSEVKAQKEVVEEAKPDAKLSSLVEKALSGKLPTIISGLNKKGGFEYFEEVKEAIAAKLETDEGQDAKLIADKLLKEEIRSMILDGKRPDGRGHTEVRELSSQVGMFPRIHGSAIFQRGLTQTFSAVTLGPPSLGQLIESAEGEEEKRYIHHYSMPPYSVGETGRVGFPSRREIGHGALAERALEPVIPSSEKFPYTIRVVSEVLSSNGSTSMASACGSTMALMDAGVPISSPVSGIAMGLVIESDKRYAVLSDIAGVEDFNGDMDFKVAGTSKGITALQLDVKTLNLTLAILKEAMAQAKEGREHILNFMLSVMPEPRKNLSVYAPKIKSFLINPTKIGDIIGPGGKIIKRIIAETGADVEVKDDGTVHISAISGDAVEAAYKEVDALTREVHPGEIFEGEVKRLMNFGAFVEYLPGREGLVHVSDMSTDYVSDPSEKVSVGDKVSVRLKEIDGMGRVNLSMILDPSDEKPSARREDRPRRGMRPPTRPYGRQAEHRGSSGPHFPTSRLVSGHRGRR